MAAGHAPGGQKLLTDAVAADRGFSGDRPALVGVGGSRTHAELGRRMSSLARAGGDTAIGMTVVRAGTGLGQRIISIPPSTGKT